MQPLQLLSLRNALSNEGLNAAEESLQAELHVISSIQRRDDIQLGLEARVRGRCMLLLLALLLGCMPVLLLLLLVMVVVAVAVPMRMRVTVTLGMLRGGGGRRV